MSKPQQFTPGPWMATKIVLNFGRVIAPAAHADRPYGGAADPVKCRETYMAAIAHVGRHTCHFSIEEADANARLIAAAPKLLDALRGMLGLVQLVEHRTDISGEELRTNHRYLDACVLVDRLGFDGVTAHAPELPTEPR